MPPTRTTEGIEAARTIRERFAGPALQAVALTLAGVLLSLVFLALFGLGMGGEWAAGMPLVLEHWPSRLRGLVSGMLLGGWYWGYLLAAATFQAAENLRYDDLPAMTRRLREAYDLYGARFDALTDDATRIADFGTLGILAA